MKKWVVFLLGLVAGCILAILSLVVIGKAMTTTDTATEETSVTEETKKILVMIICFSKKDLKEDEQKLITYYTKYANARNLKKIS